MINLNETKLHLEDRLKEVMAELSTIATHDLVTDDWVAVPDTSELNQADENAEADGVETWNERRATLASLETTYRLIKKALVKIEEGTYGLCEISNEPIEEARLKANPIARTCIAHQDEERGLSL